MNFKQWLNENDRYSTPDEFLNDPNSVTFIYAGNKLYYGSQRQGTVTHGDLVVNDLDLKSRYGIPPKMTNTEEVYNRLQYSQLFGTDLVGRVSVDVIEWEGKAKQRPVVAFWNEKSDDYKHFDDCIKELINHKIINNQAFITSALVGSVPIEAARQKIFKGVGIDPEEAMKLDLQRRLHMMTGVEKQNAMKKLGVGWSGKAPKSGIPGVKYWAPTSENFEPKDYLSIGHSFDDVDSWILKRRAKDIIVASKLGKDPEFFHAQNNIDFKGRVDHNKKAISIVAGGWGDDNRLEYVVSLLQASYPGYGIWLFGYGKPKLMEYNEAAPGYNNAKNCPYWGDAGSGIIVIAKDTGKVLLNHRGGGAVESGTYGVFGGGIFLHQVGLRSTEELMNSDIPKKHAIEELKEETSYNGPLENVHQIHVFKDSKVNREGEPCNFYYWTFLGVAPNEFPVRVGYGFEDEEGGGSGWFTFEEAMGIQPKHPGLVDLFNHAGNKIRSVVNSIRGNR